jgi:hypothetical protein
MKPKELRSGNLVKWGVHYLPVINIFADNVDGTPPYVSFKEAPFIVDISKIEPIPLTEEWLVEYFGFKYTGGDGYKSPCGELFYFSTRNGFIPDCYRGYKGFKGVKYVHQLQNLYFALTGEELLLKRPDKVSHSDQY